MSSTAPSTVASPQPNALVFDPAAAHNLVGHTLPNGWVITRKLSSATPTSGATGGNFSVGYAAERAGREAFVKVFDLASAIAANLGNIMQALATIASDHQYESSLLDICSAAHLDRIVSIVDRGQALIPGHGGMQTPLPYIVFEMAAGDIRRTLARTTAIEDAWRFRMLHQVAVGLQQLHGESIAHQDLKPSNVLIFDDDRGAKIADLGRASRNGGTIAPHDGLLVAGAIPYAPPEQAYGIIAPEWKDRREGCDLYHLGCLTTFVFTGTTPNEEYLSLPEAIRPPLWGGKWTGTYEDVLPQISATFLGYVSRLKVDLPHWAADRVGNLVTDLCNPAYQRRGDPDARQQKGSPLGIDRFISRLDRLAYEAKTMAKGA